MFKNIFFILQSFLLGHIKGQVHLISVTQFFFFFPILNVAQQGRKGNFHITILLST